MIDFLLWFCAVLIFLVAFGGIGIFVVIAVDRDERIIAFLRVIEDKYTDG